jgi:four helix bundle protein
MTDFRSLTVWHRTQALSLSIHHRLDAKTCAQFAPGMRAQLLRAANSIGANLAEGCGYGTDVLMLRHLAVAIASASELENHLLLAAHLGALRGDPQQVIGELVEIRKMLYGLRRAIEQRRYGGSARADVPHQPPPGEGPQGASGAGAATADEPAAG